MKSCILLLAFLLPAVRLPAQSNEPVRLALVSETDAAAAAVDVLTAQLSGDARIHLLERDEIAKVYREQGLSAGNRDYLKLGQVLGADGLLMLNVVETKASTNLTARLIAVKPGVILTEGSFAWPLKDAADWAGSVTNYLGSFLPKLTVLPRDAVPISVVNLRSATQSPDTLETERELKLLAIQRLSQERRFFVLERQRMQLLSGEKEFKADDSPFWSGSYLLEGVVDQNGYSKDNVTIDARLTPSKGGTPLLFAVSGSRTNFSEVINALANKVAELLKVETTAKEWSTADEAKQFYDEATWALHWGVYSEARAAADSAWALGKHDMDCATAQVRAYEVHETDFGFFQPGDAYSVPDTNELVKDIAESASPNLPLGLIWREEDANGYRNFNYVYARKYPVPEEIDLSARALQIYYAFSRTLPPEGLKPDSAWYRLGIENLADASLVLAHFHFVPASQSPVAEKLAELRSLARAVAEWISRSPSVHDSYFVGDRVAVYDELYHFHEQPSIFKCEVQWGCLWQNKPEDCFALYRELMSSPVFCYLHDDFWLRELQMPRLAAWNDDDRRRLPAVWNNFLGELAGSTNPLWQLEARALAFAEADNEAKLSTTFTNLFDGLLENRDVLVSNNVDLGYMNWGTSDLVEEKTGHVVTDTRSRLRNLYDSYYRPRLEAMQAEYRNRMIPALLFRPVFERQKAYLTNNTPYDFFGFVDLFNTPHVLTDPSGKSSQLVRADDYTKAQALEMLPLVAAYKSNLTAKLPDAAGSAQGKLRGGINQVGFLEKRLAAIINPPMPVVSPSRAAGTIVASAPVRSNTVPDDVVSNVISVDKFFAIPLDSITKIDRPHQVKSSSLVVTAHHWFEGRLVLDFNYSILVNIFDAAGNLDDNPALSGEGIAVLDPVAGSWDVVTCPEVDIMTRSYFYNRTALWKGTLYHSDSGHFRKYDGAAHQWEIPGSLDMGNCELFALNGHFYAANHEMIAELLDNGNGTHLLAANRRQPPVSALDRENLGTPVLFEGPDRSLRVSTENKIFTWTGTDWREDCAAPATSHPPMVFEDGAVFEVMYDEIDSPANVFFVPTGAGLPAFYFGGLPRPPRNGSFNHASPGANPAAAPAVAAAARWTLPPGLHLSRLAGAPRGSDFFLMMDHSGVRDIIDERQNLMLGKTVLPRDGCNAELLCYTRGLPDAQKVFLKFTDSNGCPPVIGIDPKGPLPVEQPAPGWMICTSNFMLCGLESSDRLFPGAAEAMGIGCRAGVWLIPLAQIDAATAMQKQTQAAEIASARAAAEKARREAEAALKRVIAKYDRNGNGIVDLDEREAALDDPAFIESQLDNIDANHNGWLDAEELVYFDANTNKILEPKELAGISIAQHLMAARLLKKFDKDGDGFLDRPEFNDLARSCFGGGGPFAPMVQFPDDNRDGRIDPAELELFLTQQTRRGVRPRGRMGAAMMSQLGANGSQPPDSRQLFKAEVDYYWQHPEAFNRGAPPYGRPRVGGPVTNTAAGGQAQ